MKYKFNPDNLKPGDILAGRANERIGKMIRAVLGSYTNHNALFIDHNTRGWMIGDTIAPKSCPVALRRYEDMMNYDGYVVRVWRVKNATDEQRMRASMYWQQFCDGIEYDWLNVSRLWVMRFVNNLPYQIRKHSQKTFCTKNTFKAWQDGAGIDPLLKPDGRPKLNPTPRTAENRLVQGKLEDVTDAVLEVKEA